MKTYSLQEVEDRWEECIDRVVAGETICIEDGDRRALMTPIDEETVKLYKDHNEAC